MAGDWVYMLKRFLPEKMLKILQYIHYYHLSDYARESYSQEGEDLIVNRLFEKRPFGFYVDVGAQDPVFDSVTQAFSERGWSGINIAF